MSLSLLETVLKTFYAPLYTHIWYTIALYVIGVSKQGDQYSYATSNQIQPFKDMHRRRNFLTYINQANVSTDTTNLTS